MLQVSTKYKEQILGPHSFESIFNGGRILVFSGPQPATADYPEQGVLLAQVTTSGLAWFPNGAGGAGLHFTRAGAYVTKDEAQDWRLVVSTGGVAGWFRLVGASADDGELSYSAPRIDGAIGAEMILDNTTLTVGQNVPLQSWIYTIPPVGA